MRLASFAFFLVFTHFAFAQPEPSATPLPGDIMIAEYFKSETKKIADQCLADIETLEDWTSRRELYREQLMEMLGIWPMPERGDLKPVVTGIVDHPEFTVEKLHFQSLPNLYVTANLYIPKGLTKPVPTILYLCGHSQQIKDGRSFGNKTGYQHHPAWFARNGYVCLIIDTLQLGEVQGIHHGTYREGMWWWNSRGYTPAGVETWNAIRALDYLEVRPEVDRERIGVTGRSGGGAYTWFVTAVDDRVKVAVPVAGITDLQNHVVDGAIEGHCDCMFFINTYRWDFPQLAALVAPRPLLIANTDKDKIFPLDGVIRVHEKVKSIYDLYGASDKLGLCITEGPHQDTQPLQVHAFQWFNHYLKNDDSPIVDVAEKFFDREELAVFDELPEDAINAKIHETFVPEAPKPVPPDTQFAWSIQRNEWMSDLREKVLAGWPEDQQPLNVKHVFSQNKFGVQVSAYDYDSQPDVRLRLYILEHPNYQHREYSIDVLADAEWKDTIGYLHSHFPDQFKDEQIAGNLKDEDAYGDIHKAYFEGGIEPASVYVGPRGVGLTAWSGDSRRVTHLLRRFNLLGQTWDGMRVWDVRRGIQALRTIRTSAQGAISIHADPEPELIVLSVLFEPNIGYASLSYLPQERSHQLTFLNLDKFLGLPQVLAILAEKTHLNTKSEVPYVDSLRRTFGWKHGDPW